MATLSFSVPLRGNRRAFIEVKSYQGDFIEVRDDRNWNLAQAIEEALYEIGVAPLQDILQMDRAAVESVRPWEKRKAFYFEDASNTETKEPEHG